MQFCPGVGPERAPLLEKLDVLTVGDLLLRKPKRYEDRREGASRVEVGEYCALTLNVISFKLNRTKARKLTLFEVKARNRETSQEVSLLWFNNPYIAQNWERRPPESVSVFGRVKLSRSGKIQIIAPEWEPLYQDAELQVHTQRIVPVYALTEGISQRLMRRILWNLTQQITELASEDSDWLPLSGDLTPWHEALAQLHFPDSFAAAERARRRLAFDEFFVWQTLLALRRLRRIQEKATPLQPTGKWTSAALQAAGITLTPAQSRCLREISADLMLDRPMNRLLQGDVGSGKTWVALLAMLQAVEAGRAAALMAPTEILAQQHYNNFRKILGPLGLTVGLMTGKTKTQSGDFFRPHLWVGTHALFQDSAELPDVALVVIDEQHKFGVEQRARLRRKGQNPHTLVMTATPIPRTVALTIYGDLDVSVIDELPKGRGSLRTHIREHTALPKVWKFVKEQCAAGRQAYVVYPIIGPSEAMEDVKSVEAEAGELERLLAPHQIAVIHGRVPSAERDARMAAFRKGEVSVLVATSVIEVGVDVPNATIIVIENAERFGLAQLHQLRGRVGRGPHPSHCILVLGKKNSAARERLAILEETRDGFRIAEADLEQRGLGDLLGVKQSGREHFRIGQITKDLDIITSARARAETLLKENPTLDGAPWSELRRRVRHLARTLQSHLVDRA